MNISGRMKVKTLKKEFNDEFGLILRVYEGNKFADDDATIASLRKEGQIKGDFSPQKNMKIGSFEDKLNTHFGLKVQIAGSDNSYLCGNNLTLSKALLKDDERIGKRNKKKGNTTSSTDVINNENAQPVEDTEDWDINLITIKEILFTNCDGISGQDVGLSTSSFNPVNNFDDIINYLNLIFSDDDATYLFKYKKYPDGEIILYASTYLLELGGDVFEHDIDEYSLNEIIELLNKNGVNKVLLNIIENFSEDGEYLTTGDLIEHLLIKPGQIVNVDCMDNGYGNSSYQIET